jgi:N6-adenosine-specific RNA methylase IME4
MAPDFFSGLSGRYGTILIDPPWRFQNRTGKMAPEHKRLRRYDTMTFAEIAALPVGQVCHVIFGQHLG